MDAVLSVELTAKIDALRDNFNKAVGEASKWDKATRDKLAAVDKGFSDLANKVEGSSNSISRSLAKAAAASAKSGGSIAKGADQAGVALTNLGRVAQDAPFGFVGIQNNLNPLLESFQRLRAESGSNSAALKALGQSLIGPAGLGIALSLISSAILIYQQYQQRAKKADEEKLKAQQKLIDSNKAYFESLSAVERATVKGNQDAQKEIVNLQHLYFAARDVTLSSEERHKAAKALQDQYPNTFKNFSLEEIALGKASKAYKGLSEDIFAVARAAAATDIIVENTRKLTLEQLKYNKTQKELANITKQIADRPEPPPLINLGTGFSSAGDLGVQQAAKLTAEQKRLQDELNKSQKIKTGLVKENLDIEKLVTQEIKTQGVVAITGIDRTEAKVKKAKKKLLKDNTNQLGNLNQDVGALLGIDTSKEFTLKPKLKIEPAVIGFNQLIAEAEKFNEQFANILQNGIENTLGGLGSSIGESLATGGSILNAVGSEILKGFGNFLSQFGDLLIEYGSAAVLKGKLDLAIATPGAGIIAGLAAIAAGIALKVVSGAIGSFASGKGTQGGGATAFANGGIISGPTLAYMGEYAGARADPEVVAPLSKLKKMLGQTDDAGNPISSDQGTNVFFDQRVEIDGDKLVVLTERVKAKRQRVR